MDSCHCHVKRIDAGLHGQTTPGDQIASEQDGFFRYVEERDVMERLEALRGGLRVTRGNFVDHELRNEALEAVTRGPPLARDLLVCRANEIAGWPGRQVADDARLDIDLGEHGRARAYHA